MGGYCDYALFTPSLFPLIPPCTSLSCELHVAFTPNDSKSIQIMSGIKSYYGLSTEGFGSEEEMLNFLNSEKNADASQSGLSNLLIVLKLTVLKNYIWFLFAVLAFSFHIITRDIELLTFSHLQRPLG